MSRDLGEFLIRLIILVTLRACVENGTETIMNSDKIMFCSYCCDRWHSQTVSGVHVSVSASNLCSLMARFHLRLLLLSL